MDEQQTLTAAQIWEDSKPYWTAVFEEFAKGWLPNGSATNVKDQFVKLIARTSLAQAQAARGQK